MFPKIDINLNISVNGRPLWPCRKGRIAIVRAGIVPIGGTKPIASFYGDITMGEATIDHYVPFEIVLKDRGGNVIANPQIDGTFVWSDINSLSTFEFEDALGLKVKMFPVGPIGPTTVNIRGDGDLGEGERPIVGLYEHTWLAGQAVTAEIVAGAPVPIP